MKHNNYYNIIITFYYFFQYEVKDLHIFLLSKLSPFIFTAEAVLYIALNSSSLIFPPIEISETDPHSYVFTHASIYLHNLLRYPMYKWAIFYAW